MKVRRLALALSVAAAVVSSAVAWADAPAQPPKASAPVATIATAAAAAQSAVAEIVVIHATKDDAGSGVDPRIGRMPNVGKKPFSDYTTFKLVEKKLLTLEKGRAESYAMVTGRTLKVALHGVTNDGRYVVEASIDQPGKTEYLKLLEVTAAPNEPFFVGGQSHKGGTLILSITMRPAPPPAR